MLREISLYEPARGRHPAPTNDLIGNCAAREEPRDPSAAVLGHYDSVIKVNSTGAEQAVVRLAHDLGVFDDDEPLPIGLVDNLEAVCGCGLFAEVSCHASTLRRSVAARD